MTITLPLSYGPDKADELFEHLKRLENVCYERSGPVIRVECFKDLDFLGLMEVLPDGFDHPLSDIRARFAKDGYGPLTMPGFSVNLPWRALIVTMATAAVIEYTSQTSPALPFRIDITPDHLMEIELPFLNPPEKSNEKESEGGEIDDPWFFDKGNPDRDG